MAAHARLKNEFTEDEKYHNFMSWLKYGSEIIIIKNKNNKKKKHNYITVQITLLVLWHQGERTSQ